MAATISRKRKPSYGLDYVGSTSSGNIATQSAGRPTQATGYSPYQPTQAAYSPGQVSAGSPSAELQANRVPMPSVDTSEQRRVARLNYGMDMGDVNRRLMEAAMSYGNAPKVTQFGLDAGGGDTSSEADVVSNPNSSWANIGRYLKQYDRNINEDLNNRNSFFSGANLTQHRDLNEDVGRQRGQATQDWQSAQSDLLSAITRSQAERNNQLRAADLADLMAAAASQPQGAAPAIAGPEQATSGLGGPPYDYPAGSPEESFGLNIGPTPIPFAGPEPHRRARRSTRGARALGAYAGQFG